MIRGVRPNYVEIQFGKKTNSGNTNAETCRAMSVSLFSKPGLVEPQNIPTDQTDTIQTEQINLRN